MPLFNYGLNINESNSHYRQPMQPSQSLQNTPQTLQPTKDIFPIQNQQSKSTGELIPLPLQKTQLSEPSNPSTLENYTPDSQPLPSISNPNPFTNTTNLNSAPQSNIQPSPSSAVSLREESLKLMRTLGPAVFREFGPPIARRVGPPIARRLGPPLVQKVGIPIAKKVGFPLAKRVCLPLIKKLGGVVLTRFGF
jgi:hypothetical protein